MAWRVARSLQALFAAFNARFPDRDHTTDGSIGDAAHQTSASGHNPDDTPGSLSESTDADSDPEVRAIDVDTDLNEPGVTMLDVVHAILAVPADRDRLLYVIHDRKIWSKSQGWVERTYTGGDPHTNHAHFSGDPAFDEDTQPWTSVEQFGQSTEEDEMLNAVQEEWLAAMAYTLAGLRDGTSPIPDLPGKPGYVQKIWAVEKLRELDADLEQIKATIATGGVDVGALVAALVPALVGNKQFREQLVAAANEAEDR